MTTTTDTMTRPTHHRSPIRRVIIRDTLRHGWPAWAMISREGHATLRAIRAARAATGRPDAPGIEWRGTISVRSLRQARIACRQMRATWGQGLYTVRIVRADGTTQTAILPAKGAPA